MNGKQSANWAPLRRRLILTLASATCLFAGPAPAVPEPGDAPLPEAMQSRTFELEQVTAAFVQQVISERAERSGVEIHCKPSLADDAITIIAPEQEFDGIERLLKKLEAETAGWPLHVFHLANTDAAEIAEVVETVFHPVVKCVPDPSSNAVIVRAADETVEDIERLLNKLDDGALVEKPEMRVFTLKHARGEELAETIEHALGDQIDEIRCTFDRGASALVVSAPEDGLRRVGELIAVLDVRSDSRRIPDAQNVRIFSLKHAGPDDVMGDMLEMVFGERGSFALDENRRLVIVKAPDSLFPVVEGILETLDSPSAPQPERVRLRLVWLVSGLKLEDEEAPEPPEDLEDVVAELGKIGVAGLRLAAQTLAAASGGEFRVKATPMLRNRCRLMIEGEILEGPAPETRLRLELEAVEQTPDREVELCNLETTVTAPLGHPVVLGVTPMGRMTSVFVLQMLPGT